MKRTYKHHGNLITEVHGEIKAITHISGILISPDVEGNMVINHPSGLIIKHFIGGTSKIYSDLGELLHSFSVGEEYSVSPDGVVTPK
ncbi:hypothetical protein [Shewanella glacialipiscicola]|uniref:hypothetical protein n=1 Tax=Shewanella glacialipiscicola TaxID=614069 RepID=UPI003D795DE4